MPRRPLAVVGNVIPAAQPAQLIDGFSQLGQVTAHLVGDAGVGESQRQAVRVVDGPGQGDGLAAGGQRFVLVAEQPVGVRGKGRPVHVRAGTETQPDVTASQLVGQLEVTQPVGRHPQAEGRTSGGEMRLAG